MDFTQGWGWPQWAIIFWLILKLCFGAAANGKPREDKTVSFPIIIVQTALILFILIPGGFFS